MAVRNFWTIKNDKIQKGEIEFQWEPGMALSQRKKSGANMCMQIEYHAGLRTLDISRASQSDLGVKLSAFNLMYTGEVLGDAYKMKTVECIYQGSKVFKNKGSMKYLYNVTSMEAKQVIKKIHDVDVLVGFEFDNRIRVEEATSVFYDYLYVTALFENYHSKLDLSMYDAYADVMLGKGIVACQARAVCIYKLLQQTNKLDVVYNWDEFAKWHKEYVEDVYNFSYRTDVMYEIDDDCVRYIGATHISKLLEKHNLSYIFKGGCTFKIVSKDGSGI